MTPMDWTIAAGALLLVGAVNRYFLGGRTAAVAAQADAAGIADVTIVVEGGYTPNAVEVRRGDRVRLTFDRREDNSCSDAVVIPDFKIRRDLPAFARTVVEFVADQPGRHEFASGMGMLRGSITVK